MTNMQIGGIQGATLAEPNDARLLASLLGTENAVILTALIADTDSPVLVLEPSGKIAFANDLALTLINSAGGPILGRNYQEFYPIDFANERLTFVRNVATTGKSVALDGMVNGSWNRTVMRRVIGPGGSPLVLMVFTAGSRSLRTPSDSTEVIRGAVDDQGSLSTLTHRETEILKLIGDGLSTADIARELHRSVKTIEWHRVSLGTKLKATNRVELARIAIQAGLSKLPNAMVARVETRPLVATVA